MWVRECLSCFKSNLFIIVQICLSLFLLNLNIGYIVFQYEENNSICDTDEDTYLFQYAMAAAGLFDIESADYEAACKKIKSLTGIKDIGELFETSVSVDDGFEENRDDWYQISAMDQTAASAVTYNVKEGRWLNESDRDGDVVHAVLGGEIAKRHKTGDNIDIVLDSGDSYKLEVVGILPEHCRVLYLNVLTAGQDMSSLMNLCENNIFVNNTTVFEAIKREGYGYSTAHCIVKLDKNADRKYLSDYGKIVSFGEMERASKEQWGDFVKETLEDSIIWAAVIIFGIIATSYLVEKKRRYVWGIYLLLGEKPKRLLKMHMANNVITYMIGAFLSLIIYKIYSKNTFSITGISIYHIIFDAVFMLLMILISFMGSMYILKIEPKEILTQVKE